MRVDNFWKIFSTSNKRSFLYSGSSSLTLSISNLMHLITMYFLLQGKIFKQIRQKWNSQILQNQAVSIFLILCCIIINVARGYMCIRTSSVRIIFLFKISMIIVSTHCSNLFKFKVLDLYSYGAKKQQFYCLSMYLDRGSLGHTQLVQWKHLF